MNLNGGKISRSGLLINPAISAAPYAHDSLKPRHVLPGAAPLASPDPPPITSGNLGLISIALQHAIAVS
jgi:hypothetical protein